MILLCTTCGGAYSNPTPDYMLSGIKPLSKNGECFKCDATSYLGEYILKIGTDEFNLVDAPNAPPECLTLRQDPEEDGGHEWIVTRYDTAAPGSTLPPLQYSLF